MQEKLLTYLKCLKCSSNDFELKIEEKNELEIREGSLSCKKCGQNYSIHSGIAGFLIDPLPEVKAEIRGNFESNLKDGKIPDEISEESILRMPYLKLENSYGHYESVSVNFDSMVERMELFEGATILDVGALNCWTTNRFAEKGCYSVAADICTPKHSGLESSDFFFKRGVYFERVQADMSELPFCNESFDFVFFNNVIHHSSHIEKVISQTYQILKKGGKIVFVGEPSYGIFSKKEEFGKEEREKYNINENIYPFPMYRKFLKKSGFKKIRFFFPPAIDLKLSSGKYGWKNVNEDLFEFINFFWKRRWLKKIL
ncbi:class I SAM-dependent methyltransferase, partial [candidate division KSB1 bacterium]